MWALYAVVGTAAWATERRRGGAPRSPHRAAGAAQPVILLLHPLAPAAAALGAVALARLPRGRVGGVLRRAVGAAASVAVLARRSHSGSHLPTVAAGAGTAFASALTVEAVRLRGIGGAAPWGRGDPLRLGLGLSVLGLALPWLLADVRIYVGDLPLLGRIYLSRQRLPPGARGPAVHLGHHHGMDGALLAWTALALSRQLPAVPPSLGRGTLSLALAFLLVYGLARACEDAWYEQVVKRGWTRRRLPRLVVDGRAVGRRAWAAVLAITVALHRRPPIDMGPGGRSGGDRGTIQSGVPAPLVG